jgi:hypothetical protein
MLLLSKTPLPRSVRGTALHQDATASAGQTLSRGWNLAASEPDQDPG